MRIESIEPSYTSSIPCPVYDPTNSTSIFDNLPDCGATKLWANDCKFDTPNTADRVIWLRISFSITRGLGVGVLVFDGVIVWVGVYVGVFVFVGVLVGV